MLDWRGGRGVRMESGVRGNGVCTWGGGAWRFGWEWGG